MTRVGLCARVRSRGAVYIEDTDLKGRLYEDLASLACHSNNRPKPKRESPTRQKHSPEFRRASGSFL